MKYTVACVLVLILISINPAFGEIPVVTNLTNQEFTVSWTTAVSEEALVEYGTNACLNMKAYDIRGQKTVDDTHYVTIKELSGTTTYYWQAVSNNNRSNIFTTTTVPAISLPHTGIIAIGKVCFQETTIPAKGSIVYAILKTGSGTESDRQSTIVGKDEKWFISLDNFRSLDGCSPFPYSAGDSIAVEVMASRDGTAAGTTTIATTTTNAVIDTATLTLTGDIIAPTDTSINPTPGNNRISLSWDTPDILSGASGVLILRSQQGYPQSTPTTGMSYEVGSSTIDGTVVYMSTATDTTTWTDGTLTNNTTYYYRIFTYDGAHNYSQGISCRATPVINLDNTRVYPNPLVGDGYVYFDNLLANTHICIYNVAGELVLEADSPTGTYQWHPKDIASGIYLYLLKSDNEHVWTGKIGIVR